MHDNKIKKRSINMANESKTLKNAAVGATVKVKKLTGDGPVKR